MEEHMSRRVTGAGGGTYCTMDTGGVDRYNIR